ncbi:MAG: ZIP family metal transporter [Candidatus Bathyarchaeia archaeon]
MTVLYSILATIAVSLLSFIGVFALSLRERMLDKLLFVLVSFAAGAILGAAFLSLLPEALNGTLEIDVDTSVTFLYMIVGFIGFFFLERFIYWYHGHVHGHESASEVDPRVTVKEFIYINLVGDAVHNFIDGTIIAASFFLDISLGVAITVSAIFHEIPQEIGDFGVLLYGGLARSKALLFNFFAAVTAVAGALLSNFFLVKIQNLVGFLIAFAAGGFIYLAASELIPEIQKEKEFWKSLSQFILFILGIAFIWALSVIFPE